MPTLSESLVSKIRKTTQGLPALQKWAVESGQAVEYRFLDSAFLQAVYCVFRNGRCIYVGQTGNLLRRFGQHKVVRHGDQICYVHLPRCSARIRKNIEAEIASILRPTIGTARGATVPYGKPKPRRKCNQCGHRWRSKFVGLPVKCPNQDCQSNRWNKPKQ